MLEYSGPDCCPHAHTTCAHARTCARMHTHAHMHAHGAGLPAPNMCMCGHAHTLTHKHKHTHAHVQALLPTHPQVLRGACFVRWAHAKTRCRCRCVGGVLGLFPPPPPLGFSPLSISPTSHTTLRTTTGCSAAASAWRRPMWSTPLVRTAFLKGVCGGGGGGAEVLWCLFCMGFFSGGVRCCWGFCLLDVFSFFVWGRGGGVGTAVFGGKCRSGRLCSVCPTRDA